MLAGGAAPAPGVLGSSKPGGAPVTPRRPSGGTAAAAAAAEGSPAMLCHCSAARALRPCGRRSRRGISETAQPPPPPHTHNLRPARSSLPAGEVEALPRCLWPALGGVYIHV